MGSPVVVSACLAGVPCRYDGGATTDADVAAAVAAGAAVPLCAELLGGLRTPRPTAEIVGGDGDDVLDGRARVVDAGGRDVTPAYVAGALAVADRAVALGASRAILQERSPSCGSGRVYDGTFSGALVEGVGVTAAALRRRGVEVEAAGSERQGMAPRDRAAGEHLHA